MVSYTESTCFLDLVSGSCFWILFLDLVSESGFLLSTALNGLQCLSAVFFIVVHIVVHKLFQTGFILYSLSHKNTLSIILVVEVRLSI